ncbi:sulfite exporter TauE/SafE family protein [Pseudoruegeria sp. HB172150]|uniref:sulfite exporter TauE/SafE family protein n=1 Tax=Pseudoruegeria sp. HB172150 TaxID=2721164 RepID=UPI00352D7E8D
MIGEFALIFVAIAMGGLLKGAIGAGAPVLAVPVLALFFDVQLAVAVMVVPNLLSNLWQGWFYRRDMLPNAFTWGFATSGGIGVLIGTVILASVPAQVLLIAVAATVFGYIAFRLARPDWVLSYTAALRAVWPTGTVAGVLQGATGISAPVSITFLNSMKLKRESFIATISVFFALISALQIPVLWWYGIMTPQRFLYGLLAMIPLFGAMPVGNFIARHLPPRVFDRVILVLLALIAVRMIFKALQ